MHFLTRQNCLGSSWFRDSRPTQFAVLAAYCLLVAPAASAQTHDGKLNPPVATVSGQTIYEDELLSTAQGQLMPLRTQEFEIKRKALDDLIQQKLLEAAAKKKGITAEQLLTQEVDSKVADPSDAELQGYYMAVRDRTKSSFAEIQTQLKQLLKQAHVQQARQDYLKHLRDEANVTVELSAPRVNVAYDPARVRGNPKAPVMIVEFSDYQCPYCNRVEATLKEVLAKYGNKVSLAYRDFPLTAIHSQAEIAAEASRCALEQGRFWEYHDQLFAAPKLDKDALVEYARNLKLDHKQFGSCLTSGKYKAEIEKDSEEGKKAGVQGTPGFFINGVALYGAQPPDAFARLIDDELGRKNNRPTASVSVTQVER
jgi:protein-disulfide isomerase